MTLYKAIARPCLFTLDPETAHHLVFRGLPIARALGGVAMIRAAVGKLAEDPVTIAGIRFPNRIGLAAGFDKDVLGVDLFAAMGFGHLELGTITPRPQQGNPRPRIFRFPKDEALINRMGFPSGGADAVFDRLQKIRASGARLPVLGINIGKAKDTPIDQALADYQYSCRLLSPLADYIAINVSSPNTQDLRQLQTRERLTELLSGLAECNPGKKPLFVKVAPDLSWQELDDVVAACGSSGAAGIIATNTTVGRQGLSVETKETGGLSGRPLHQRSVAVVRHLCQAVGGRMAIVGVGGISSSRDAMDMFECGASLVQLYTSVIYEGPLVVRNIQRGIAALPGSKVSAAPTSIDNIAASR